MTTTTKTEIIINIVSETSTSLAIMNTDVAALQKSVENIEADGKETKKSIAEINRTLLNKLTGK